MISNESLYIKGSNYIIAIIKDKIDVAEYIKTMKSPEVGALSLFIGTTKDTFNGKKVLKLEYEFHPTMAIKQMENLARTAISKFNLNRIAIIHRVGKVDISEESILIISASVHRREALDSTDYIIEEFKRSIPIWKKEYYQSEIEEYVWKENC